MKHLIACSFLFALSPSGITYANDLAAACDSRPALPPAATAAMEKCLSCHTKSRLGPTDLSSLDTALCRRSRAFVDGMVNLALSSPRLGFQAEDADSVRQRQSQLHQQASPQAATRRQRVQLLAPSRQAQLESMLPRGDTQDPGGKMLEDLRSAGAVFYDTSVLPKMTQTHTLEPSANVMNMINPAAAQVVRRDHVTGQAYADRGGLEFPWLHAAGTDKALGTSSFRFFVPPATGPMVKTFRVDHRHKAMYGGFANEPDKLYGFRFLPGTTFGEILAVKDPSTGDALPFEIRLRRVEANGEWFFDVLRPFTSQADLAQALSTLAPQNASLQNAVKELQQNTQGAERMVDIKNVLGAYTMTINNQAERVLLHQAFRPRLPRLDAATVRQLLRQTPFRSVFGLSWARIKDSEGKVTLGYAAEGAEAFSVFPAGYLGSHLRLFSSQCIACHADTQTHVTHFNPQRGVMGTDDGSAREWYGHMLGSTPQKSPYGMRATGIFSFHPFAASTVSDRFYVTKPVVLQDALKKAGLIQWTNEVE